MGLTFSSCSSDYEEEIHLEMPPRDLARYLSRKKAEAVAHKYGNALIIGADTFIHFNAQLLGKPCSKREAVTMLKQLSDTVHEVITGFTIIDTGCGKVRSKSVVTKVSFKKITQDEIKAYVKSGEPLGKAGAYAIQGRGALFIKKIDGDYYNVMGLPLYALSESLKDFGVFVLGRSRN